MNTFKRLLNLYSKSGAERTPLEDYCTECLAGILESDQEILDGFVNNVLNIYSDQKFTLKTQVSYNLEDRVRVDLVFESLSWICYLEMKVYSSEGENQLKRYRKYLSDESIHQGKKTALRYCTLYIEEKEDLDEVEQLRWKNIADYLVENTESSLLINEFYQFLKEMKMAGNERFTYQDLIGLQTYGELTAKVEEIFQLIKPDLESYFGKSSRGIGTTSEIFKHNRLGLICQYVLGDGWSEVLVAFRFSGSKIADGPLLVVQLWISKSNTSYNDFRKAISGLSEYDFKESIDANGGSVRFEEPLAEFLESENQFGEITEWIKDKLDKLSRLKKKTSDLDWRTPS